MTDSDLLADVWWLYYDTGDHLWLAVRGTGDYDAVAGVLVLGSTLFSTAAEYHYDGGRQRYLVRQRNPNPSNPEDPNSPRWTVIGTGQWRDYLGNSIYNDYTVDQATGTVTNGRAYIPGIGFDDPSLAETPAYLGNDLIGTTRRIVGSATPTSPVLHRNVYTAFGELISSTGSESTRYGYAGEWGYETPEASFDPLAELGWLHVGERYYDPAVGRFMQRDPIGILGGLNTYIYVNNNPILSIDPDGQTTIFGPPSATGPPNKGMFDKYWTKVHYCSGFSSGFANISFFKTSVLAIKWELWEPYNWPGFDESYRNRIGDVFAAQLGWFDGQRAKQLFKDFIKFYSVIHQMQKLRQ